MRNPFSRTPVGEYPKSDAGSGDLKHYAYSLVPTKKSTVIRLAGSDACQQELAKHAGAGELQAFVGKRTIEEERTDAPVAVRFLVDRGMTGVVGWVPRGLEPAVLEAVSRLEEQGRSTRIPAVVISTRHGYRVVLQMGRTR